MTVNDIIKSAMALMGYGSVDVIGYSDEAMLHRAIVAVNHIIMDLGGKLTVKETNEEIFLPVPALRAIPYGVAMLLSLAEGDAADRDDIIFLEPLPLFNAEGEAI